MLSSTPKSVLENRSPTVVFLQGIPGSGKSTFARTLVETGYVRVNKDEIRAQMLKDRPGVKRANESKVIEERNARIKMALSAEQDVVVDDTNLNPVHEQTVRGICAEYSAYFILHRLDTPVEECIRRNALRTGQERVPDSVIFKMHKELQGLLTAANPFDGVDCNPPRDRYLEAMATTKPMAYIFDLDGTLALNLSGRPHFGVQADLAYKTDVRNFPVTVLVYQLKIASKITIVFLTGREGTELGMQTTKEWLEKTFCIPQENLNIHFRAKGDYRKDSIIKRELYEKHIEPRYHVLGVFDDRPQVLRMWWELGLFVFNVGSHKEF